MAFFLLHVPYVVFFLSLSKSGLQCSDGEHKYFMKTAMDPYKMENVFISKESFHHSDEILIFMPDWTEKYMQHIN